MYLTKDFTLAELTVSQEAARRNITNKPNTEQIANLKALCENILQPLRNQLGKPIVITSGFRSVALNRRIGGSVASQHTKGEAADFIVPGVSITDVVELIQRIKLPFDQLINEDNAWVHVSYSPKHRRQVLNAKFNKGKVEYTYD